MQPDSAKVLDFLFASCSKKDQIQLLSELYSPEFVVFAEEVKGKNLGEILVEKPEKRFQILENMRKVIIFFKFIYNTHYPLFFSSTSFVALIFVLLGRLASVQ